MGIEVVNNANAYQGTRTVSADYQRAGVEYAIPQTVQMGDRATADDNSRGGMGSDDGQATPQQIKSAISSANRRAHFGHTNAEFSYHEATKRISVKIIDKDTNEVIKEIPPEETLEMISKMWELAGIMVDEKR